MREDIWVDELNFQSYQNNEIDFIDDSGKSCCVHSLSDRLAEERKRVCDAVYKLTRELMSFGYDTVKIKDVETVLEQFDRGE